MRNSIQCSYALVWASLLSVSSAFLGQHHCAVLPPVSHPRGVATTEAKPTRKPTTSTTTATRLYDAPEPLAEEGTWQAFLDEETTGLVYYFDVKTGESLWEPPTATFPEVRLPRRKQRLADTLRQEYRKARQRELNGGGGGGPSDGPSSTSIVIETETKEREAEQRQQPQQQQQQQPSWIDGIFDVEKDTAPQKQEIEDVPEGDIRRDWFGFFDDGKKKDQGAAAQAVAEVKEEQPKKDWLGGIFRAIAKSETEEDGSGPPDATNGETAVKETEKKFGVPLAPFTSVQPQQQQQQQQQPPPATTQVERRAETVVEEKPKPKKVPEKVVELAPTPIKIELGSHILPHPAKMKWGGEDAVFIKGRTFGVFDGVSGADKLDGVPLYSRTLANEMKKMVGNNGVTVQQMTTYMTNAAAYADGAATGASTAVVASIGENGFLQALSIGDSYCMVIRDGKVTAKTREISHYWECPYQLSEDSPDRPRDGTKLNVELIPGDVIVMGSDGVFDNVSDDMLLELVAKSPSKPATIAKKICDLSRKQSLDKNSITPYAKQAQRRGDPDYRNGLGGKIDDVSAVVVICK